MAAISTIQQTLSNSPLPELIEKLGMAITQAQAALDKNSLNTLKEMSSHKMLINNKEYNLLSLGFTPTFYAFTEASIEAKMEFSMSEETSIAVGLDASVEKKTKTKIIAATVNASYARKFEQSAEGSSSIAAKLIALPPPDKLLELLKEENDNRVIDVTSFEFKNAPIELKLGDSIQLELDYLPQNATNPQFEWKVLNDNVSINATISSTGLLTVTLKENGTFSSSIDITIEAKYTSTDNKNQFLEKTITINN